MRPAYRPSCLSARRHASMGLLLLCLTGCGPTSFLITPMPGRQDLQERVVSRESIWATDKIAIVDVTGVLQNGRPQSLLGTSGENPVALFVEKLEQAARDDHVRAVVLRINTPGGGVTATELMYAELQRFREQTDKPVIAAMLDVAASGGYYLACGCDRIIALPTTITGSIGVVMLLPDFSGTMAKLGVRVDVIKSDAMKDMGSLFRTMNTEERAIFQGLIDGMYARFLDVVGHERPDIPPDRLRALADGRVYLGEQALASGLVDQLGTVREAIEAAKKAAGLDDSPIKVVQYARPAAHRPNIYARGGDLPTQVNLLNVQLPEWLAGPAPQLMYIWAPGW